MIEKLPYYYRKSEVVKELYRVIQLLLDKLSADATAQDMRLFITTTDDFTLHEKDVGVAEIVADNETKRSRVIAKLQGYNIAIAFSTTLPKHAPSSVTIRLT